MAVVNTLSKGYDLDYVWCQADSSAAKGCGGLFPAPGSDSRVAVGRRYRRPPTWPRICHTQPHTATLSRAQPHKHANRTRSAAQRFPRSGAIWP